MTMQEIKEIKQRLLQDFTNRTLESLKTGEIYDFSIFLTEPIEQFRDILGPHFNIKYVVQVTKNGEYAYRTKSNWTLLDWTAVLMLNILKLVYKINIPQKLLESVTSFELLAFMFFALWDNMIINRVVTTRTKSSLRAHNVRMLTVAEVRENRAKFEEALASHQILLFDLNPKAKNNGLFKLDFVSLKLPVLVSPETDDEEMSVEVLTELDTLSSGVEAEIRMYAPQAYLDILVQGLLAFMKQVKAVCRYTHVKSDLSMRVHHSTLNTSVLTKIWEDTDRINLALENVSTPTDKGYIQIPDLELPQNDTSQTRALNLLRIVDFRIQKNGLAKYKKRSKVAYKDARLALQLYIMDMCPDEKLKPNIYNALRNADVITDYTDILSFDTPEEQYKRVMEVLSDKINNTAGFDAKCYDALKKLCDNPEKVLLELQPIDFRSTSAEDVTMQFASVSNQLEWLNDLARKNIVRLQYINSGRFSDTHVITKNTQIVSEIYGLGWKTTGRNYSLFEKKTDLEASIQMSKTVNSINLLQGIASEWGIAIADSSNISDVKEYLTHKLTELLEDVNHRMETKGVKAQKRNEGKFVAYSLEVNKALMRLDPKNFNLFRSFSLANIEKVEVLTLNK